MTSMEVNTLKVNSCRAALQYPCDITPNWSVERTAFIKVERNLQNTKKLIYSDAFVMKYNVTVITNSQVCFINWLKSELYVIDFLNLSDRIISVLS